MHRARPLATIAILACAAFALAGCTGDVGPSGPGIAGVQHASAEVDDHGNTFLDRIFGSYEPPSSVLHDTSIDDTVTAGYGAVPGADTLDNLNIGNLSYDDDPMSSSSVSDLAFDDPTIQDGALDVGMSSLDDNPLSSRLTFDSAMSDADATYGTMGGGDVDTLDDLALDDGAPPVDDDMTFDDGGAPVDDVGMGDDPGLW